jgi:signal transduction histidine kinase
MGMRTLLAALSWRKSIRRFVATGALLALLLLLVGDGWFSYRQAANRLTGQHDRALVRVTAAYAQALATQGPTVAALPARVLQEAMGLNQPPHLRFRVVDEAGRLLVGEPDLPAPPPAAWEGLKDAESAALYDDKFRGDLVRVCALRLVLARGGAQALPVTAQVLEPYGGRLAAQGELLREIVWRSAWLLLLAMLLIGAVMQLALRPLRQLMAEVNGRLPTDHRLLATERPEELAPLVQAMNQLLTVQQASVDQQRKFLADASHQLRTPLAVLRTQLQGLTSGQLDVKETLAKMLRTVERATGLANQLLSMAKVDQLARQGEWQPVDVEAVARDVALEFAPLVARKRLDFSLESSPLLVQSDAWLLGELLRNLLSNAIHHSSKGAALGIVVRRLRGELELIVWDQGGGVDEAVRERLFEPFSASKGGTGIGLGLSICRQIAESMNASVALFNRVEAGRVIGVDAVVRWPQSMGAGGASPAQPGGDERAPADGGLARLAATDARHPLQQARFIPRRSALVLPFPRPFGAGKAAHSSGAL